MIRINKGDAPAVLLKRGKETTEKHNSAYEASPGTYISGEDKFKFPEHYSDKEVVEALRICQYDKCCFSEAKFTGDYPNVEHFRPKGRLDEYPKGKKERPGYYWLAYQWENLYLCKGVVNSSYKKNFFPLKDETKRNRTHMDTHLEEPMIIDPGLEDPREHIRFHDDEPYGITERGGLNIKLLGLRHSSFEESRRTRFKVLGLMKKAVDEGVAAGMNPVQPPLVDIVVYLKAAIRPEAEFSSMAIDLLSGWPLLA